MQKQYQMDMIRHPDDNQRCTVTKRRHQVRQAALARSAPAPQLTLTPYACPQG